MLDVVAVKQEDGSFLIGFQSLDSLELQIGGELTEIDSFIERNREEYIFGLLSYQLAFSLLNLDLKTKQLRFPLAKFWTCKTVYRHSLHSLELLHGLEETTHIEYINRLFSSGTEHIETLHFQAKLRKKDYLDRIKEIQSHLQLGNIYELNFCQNFTTLTPEKINPEAVFARLYRENPTPNAAFVHTSDWSLASASPERFIRKKGTTLSSDPIKGTAPRGKSTEEDEKLKSELQNSVKERAENVMIVDLVRNDLARIANKGTVKVNELCGIYSYPTVHQMISSVSCEIPVDLPFSHILKALFPMGSMTGAPKRSAVKIARDLENFNREWYSGSIGVILPNGDFDFNVLIRTLIMDEANQQVSCAVGGAITTLSEAEAEYEECRIKIAKIISLFGTCSWS